MQKNIKPLIFSTVLFIILTILFFIFQSTFKNLETDTVNFRIKHSTNSDFLGKSFDYASDKIIIINIDDISQYEASKLISPYLMYWPWKRSYWSKIINYLESAQPKVLLLDILFENFEDNTLSNNSSDMILANTLKNHNNIILSTTLTNSTKNEYKTNTNPDFIPSSTPLEIINETKNKQEITYYEHSQIPSIYTNNTTIGANNIVIDSNDKQVKEFQPVYKLIQNSKTYYIPSVALASALKYIENDDILIQKENKLSFPNYEINTNTLNQATINWHGSNNTYKTIPLSAILVALKNNSKVIQNGEEEIPLSFFKDKILIISHTLANNNIQKTPVTKTISNAEIYATIIDNIINDANIANSTKRNLIQKTQTYINIIITFILILLTVLNVYRAKKSVTSFFVQILIISAYTLISYFIFIYPEYRIQIPIITPLYFAISAYLVCISFKLIRYKNYKENVISIYSNSVSKNVLKKLIKQKKVKTANTQKQKITTILCSIKDFANITKNIETDVIIDKLNEFFSTATQEILNNSGTIGNITNGEILAYWGYPIKTETDTINAVKCAISIQKLLKENPINFEENKPLNINISIVTEDAILGYIKTINKTNFSILSNGINTANKIKEVCNLTQKDILLCQETYQQIKQEIQANYKGEIKLKNSEEKIKIYEPSIEIAKENKD